MRSNVPGTLPVIDEHLGGRVKRLTVALASAFNPSLVEAGPGYLLSIRSANYRFDDELEYVYPAGTQTIVSRNYLASLGPDLAVSEIRPIALGCAVPLRYPSPYVGFEDLRLVRFGGRLFAFAVVCDMNAANRPQIALLEIVDHRIREVRLLAWPGGEPQKNWMPFLADGELLLVQSCRPLTIVRVDVETGRLETVARHRTPSPASAFRGGSGGLAVQGGHLFVIHETGTWIPRTPIYSHRFMMLDSSFRLVGATSPFSFTGASIEFCAGLARRDNDLITTLGILDRTAAVAVTSTDVVLGSLDSAW